MYCIVLYIYIIYYLSDKTESDSPFPVPKLIKKFPARIKLCCLQQIPLN